MKMANVLLTCLGPSAKPLCPEKPAFDLFSTLVVDLQRLNKSLEHNPLSLKWCSEALLVVKKIHSHFLFYFATSKVPASLQGACMIDEYMNATLDLLDLCNLLKSAVSGLDRSRLVIDFMVKRLRDASFATATCNMELDRLEIEKSNYPVKFKQCKEMKLNIHESKVSKVKLKNKSEIHVLEPIWSTMSMITLFILCSIIHPTPIRTDEGLYTEFRDSGLFTDCIQKPSLTFDEKFQDVQGKGKPILHENQMIEDAFAAIKSEIVSVHDARDGTGKVPAESLAKLKNRSVAVKDGIDLFETVVNELFDDVIKGRKKMIELIRINNHMFNC